MQRIERYGVIALVFLLVTVAAVSFWGEGRDKEQAPEEESVAHAAAPAAPASARPREGRNENARESSSTVPLNTRGGSGRARQRAEIVELEPEPAAAEADDPRRRGERETPTPEPEPADEAPALYNEWPGRLPGRDTRTAPGTESRPSPLSNQPRSATPPAPTPTVPPPTIAPRNQPPAVSDGAFAWHDVQPNETLSEIAEARLGKASRWREIQAMNAGLTPESLRSGTRIKVPTDGAVQGGGSQPSTPASREPRSETGRVYVVKAGDTLSRIAARELGSVDRMPEILALNPGLDPDVVKLGAPLRLPAGTPAAPAARSIAQATPPAASEPRRESSRRPRVR